MIQHAISYTHNLSIYIISEDPTSPSVDPPPPDWIQTTSPGIQTQILIAPVLPAVSDLPGRTSQIYRQTDLQTDRQIDRHTDSQIYRHTDSQIYKKTNRQTDSQIYRHTDSQICIDIQTVRLSEICIDIQTVRYIERQIYRQGIDSQI